MTFLPPRRKHPKSGIARAPKRVWSKHRAFIRRHHCVVPGCPAEPIEVSHIRTAANAGVGIKPHDSSSTPMCTGHHREYHQDGHNTFEKRHGVNLKAIAAELLRRSPDTEMRASLRLVNAEELVDG